MTDSTEQSRVKLLAEECGTDPEVLAKVVALLADFPVSGKPQDTDAVVAGVLLGFIEKREISKACPTCGTNQHHYSYFKPTLAGRLFSRVMGDAQ